MSGTSNTGLTAVRLPKQARHVLIGVNPTAGAGRHGHLVGNLAELLRLQGFQVELVTEIEQLATRIDRGWCSGALRMVVAAGGDGTVAQVANHLENRIPICVLPLGTENLLAKYLQLPADAVALAKVIEQGWTVRLDAGCADGRLFLLMLSCGIDAEVVRRAHSVRRGNITHLHYVKPIVQSLRSYKYPKLIVRVEEVVGEQQAVAGATEARWVFVANLPRYAGGLQFVPGAVGTDGLLDVCTFRGGGWWHSLRYLGGVLTGQHRHWADCQTFRTKRLHIATDSEVPYQLDGDPGGILPVNVKVLPARVTCVVNSSWARTHGFELQVTDS